LNASQLPSKAPPIANTLASTTSPILLASYGVNGSEESKTLLENILGNIVHLLLYKSNLYAVFTYENYSFF